MYSLRKKWHQWLESLALALGCFNGAHSFDWVDSKRLVFVCTGNICRSSYAEALARQYGMDAISCGTDTTSNCPADPIALDEARRRGLDLSTHRTTRWQEVGLRASDIIVVAQLRHAIHVWRRTRKNGCRIIMMSSLLLPEYAMLWDPFGRPRETYVATFDLIDRAVKRIAELRGVRI